METEPTWNTALVVDDDAAARAQLARILNERGYDAVGTSHVAALSTATSVQPGLIVLGIDPERAHALARELRAHPVLARAFIVAIAGGPIESQTDGVIDAYMRPPATGGSLAAALQRRLS